MKRSDNKSRCPINFSLETIGDNWSMLIVRDIVYFGKKTFNEFLHSEEGISTNILTARLIHLEQKNVLSKMPHPTDKRKEVYCLTEKGLNLIPILLELAIWGFTHDEKTEAPQSWFDVIQADKEKVIDLVRETVKRGGSIFVGSDSVVSKLRITES
ncbi:transcriptional regulator [Paenibacillus piri]|uniref:Transcriptional regulator n=2 Tax=Paenibacillus piri TaxID=2547395 RepID=A0A4R5KHB2_9BACL|nr:helix-turn-helix domain-containing protein [Paenibacillus piri]TDF94811.1 transcriptional regulator [Paenibacillus piri]